MPGDQLFRMLAARPVAMVALEYKIPGTSFQLCVRAIRNIDEFRIMDECSALPEEVRSSHRDAMVICASLLIDDAPAFSDVEEVGLLSELEIRELGTEVELARSLICPSYLRSNVVAWGNHLREGAGHYSNLLESCLMADCVIDSKRRPEMYFGGLVSDLTDGQKMAFTAACEVAMQMRESGEK